MRRQNYWSHYRTAPTMTIVMTIVKMIIVFVVPIVWLLAQLRDKVRELFFILVAI
ncbi:MAG: hypothetical protein OD811_00435 [Alphaproteobacteria bacterium]